MSGGVAFIPNPLPPTDLVLSPSLIQELSAADRALGVLDGIGRTIPDPHLLLVPFLRREAVLSSKIEGTVATLGDLAVFEAQESDRKDQADVREVWNYVNALDAGLSPSRQLPISLRLFRDLHGILMADVRGASLTPGEFRTVQNSIGPPGSTERTATYVPPPVPDMLAALGDFEKFLHEQQEHPALVTLALAHYQFEAIHPFLDGNGRLGRLLITLLLCERGLLKFPLLYLSAYFERTRQEYYRRLLGVTLHGAFEEWISYFLAGVTEQCADAVRRIDRLRDLRASYYARLKERKASSLIYRLVDLLAERPAVTVTFAAERLGVTHRSANRAITELSSLEILYQPVQRQRNRVFIAREFLATLESAQP